jgi:hypothetical protein
LPRFLACVAARRAIELAALARGERSCALITVPASAARAALLDCEARGLKALPLGLEDGGHAPLETPEIALTLCVARAETLDAALDAFRADDASKLGALLGYPRCCTDAFIAAEHADESDPGRTLLHAAPANAAEPIAFAPETNPLLRPIGIEATAHVPCTPTCRASIEHAERRIALGRRSGFDAAMNDLLEILDWPMTWSALHGIAEVKTPVLKFAYGSDLSPRRVSLARAGARFVASSGKGGTFPYQW